MGLKASTTDAELKNVREVWERGGCEREVFKVEYDEGEEETYADIEIVVTVSDEKRC